MNADQLSYVVELARLHTLQRAADSLHITKSGLSKAISQIERELGVKLFDRQSSGTFLTPQGEHLLPLMQQELSLNYQLHQNANALKNVPNGKIVRIGHVNSLLHPVMDEYLATAKHDQTTIRLEISQHSPSELISLIDAGKLDLGFLDCDAEMLGKLKLLDFHEIHSGPIQLFTRHDHPLATSGQLTIDELRSLRFVTINDPLDQRIFDHLQNVCGPLNVVLKTDSYWAACQAAEQLDAAIVACMLVVNNSVENFSDYNMNMYNLESIVNDRMYHGWISNPYQPLDRETQDFINRVGQRILRVLQ